MLILNLSEILILIYLLVLLTLISGNLEADTLILINEFHHIL